MNTIEGDLTIKGNLTLRGNLEGNVPRSTVVLDQGVSFPLSLENFRVWDAFQTPLGTAGTDDLGITAGAFATGCPYLHAGDMNAAGSVTRYGRTTFTLPIEYNPGGLFVINFSAGMLTAVASVAATVDVEVYKLARTTLKTGSDLVVSAAQSINSTTFADIPFSLTATGLNPGDMFDIRVTIAANSATASSHFAAIAVAEVLLDVKG